MSWRHIEAIKDLNITRPPVNAVLMVIAHHTNDHSGKAWPGLERIGRFTGLKRRAIQAAIKELELLGYLAVRRGSGRTPSVYTLTLPGTPAIEITDQKTLPPEALGPEVHVMHPSKDRGASRAPQGRRTDTPGVHEVHPNTKEHNRIDASDARAMPDFNENWAPPVGTVEKIKADEGLTEEEIERELKLFILKNLEAPAPPRNPVAAFRTWCARLKTLTYRPPPPPPKRRKADAAPQQPLGIPDDTDARLPLLRDKLRQNLGERTYAGWFGPEAVAFKVEHDRKGTELVVVARSVFMSDWIRDHFHHKLAELAKEQGLIAVRVRPAEAVHA